MIEAAIEKKKILGSVKDLDVYKLDKDYEHVFAMLINMERKVDALCK